MPPLDARRILIPVDFSECSRQALEYGGSLARRLGASVHLLYASEVPKELVGEAAGRYQSFLDPDVRAAKERLAEDAALLEREGVPCTTEVVPGLPLSTAHTILEHAASGDYDLVVMGTHGRCGTQRLWVGSVAERVVRHATIPVLTVRVPS